MCLCMHVCMYESAHVCVYDVATWCLCQFPCTSLRKGLSLNSQFTDWASLACPKDPLFLHRLWLKATALISPWLQSQVLKLEQQVVYPLSHLSNLEQKFLTALQREINGARWLPFPKRKLIQTLNLPFKMSALPPARAALGESVLFISALPLLVIVASTHQTNAKSFN